jgi:hypothetical protein
MSDTSRESSWAVDPGTGAILRQISSLGLLVSVHRLPSSLLRTIPETTEMHALNPGTSERFVARVAEEHSADADYKCACALAEQVGIDLEG